MAEAFGNQPEQVVEAAGQRAQRIERDVSGVTAQSAVTFSRERNLEREAVVDQRELLRDALRRSMGEASFEVIRAEFEKHVEQGNFIEVVWKTDAPGRAFTTQEMIDCERDTIRAMREGIWIMGMR